MSRLGGDALTVGFLESLIYAVGRKAAEAAALASFTRGPASSAGWPAAFEYVHLPDEHASDPREA